MNNTSVDPPLWEHSDLAWAITKTSSIVSSAEIERHFYKTPDVSMRLQSIIFSVNTWVSELRPILPEPEVLTDSDMLWALEQLRQLVSPAQVDRRFWRDATTGSRLKQILFGCGNEHKALPTSVENPP